MVSHYESCLMLYVIFKGAFIELTSHSKSILKACEQPVYLSKSWNEWWTIPQRILNLLLQLENMRLCMPYCIYAAKVFHGWAQAVYAPPWDECNVQTPPVVPVNNNSDPLHQHSGNAHQQHNTSPTWPTQDIAQPPLIFQPPTVPIYLKAGRPKHALFEAAS